MFSLAKFGKGTVSCGLTFESTQRAIERFALSDLDFSHFYPSPRCVIFPFRDVGIILHRLSLVNSFFKFYSSESAAI